MNVPELGGAPGVANAAELSVPELVRSIEAGADYVETPIANGKLVWRAWGSGEALVLLHGGHGSWTHWIRNVLPLSERRRIIVPDMPGYGDSGDATEPVGAHSLSTDLFAGLNTILGETIPFDLAGFSFGGLIAGHVARLAGSRARNLILVGTAGMGLTRPPLPREMIRWRSLEDSVAIREAHRTNLGIHMLRRAASVDDLAVMLQTENARRTRLHSRPISRGEGLRTCLPEVSARLAGIWGEEDATARGFLPERADMLRRFDPGAEFEVIPNAGHWVQYEDPDAFNAAVIGILDAKRIRVGEVIKEANSKRH